MKAIETIYNGYRFRSRLEARWAVFFDEMGIEYEYEPQGYKMDNGKCYLPDFYLPQLDYYVEVKGDNDHIKEDIRKCYDFVFDKKTSIAILTDVPYSKESNGVYWFPVINYIHRYCDVVHGTYGFFAQFELYYNDKKLYTVIRDDAWHGKKWFPMNATYEVIKIKNGIDVEPDKKEYDIINTGWAAGIDKGMLKARQARFEHGEKP